MTTSLNTSKVAYNMNAPAVVKRKQSNMNESQHDVDNNNDLIWHQW